MSTENINIENKDSTPYYHDHNSRWGKIVGGIIVVAAGILLLLRQMGYDIPFWIFTWQMLLITIGLYIGIKHRFRHFGWLIPTAIGGVFMADLLVEGFSISQYFWPLLIIFIGLVIIFKPKRKFDRHKMERWKQKFEKYERCYPEYMTNREDYIESVSVFGGVKKNIISKNFKGGEVTTVFGGTEINLSQADINGRVEMEISQVFGGTKLIVPPNWEVQTDLVTILGGIDDKRNLNQGLVVEQNKILVLTGAIVFGGIEIKSF